MTQTTYSIAIIGAGIGGLAAAAALKAVGITSTVYEQAPAFARVGAGIQMTPNAMKVLRGFGLEDRLRKIGFAPDVGYNREWNTGNITFTHTMGDSIERRYGAPDLAMHRGDLHEALASLSEGQIHFGRKLVGIECAGLRLKMTFEDGCSAEADAVVGADGIHSAVLENLFGIREPRFSGKVAYRATFPARLLNGAVVDDRVKWWGPDRHLVSYMLNEQRSELHFLANIPEPDYRIESWSTQGDLGELRDAFKDFHPQVHALLNACPEVRKWAMFERDPLPSWTQDRVLLIGDACHPMLPYMAQGAAMALEDAVVMARCLAEVGTDGISEAFRRTELNRKERTSQVQLGARQNKWMHFSANTDWVYEYDAWHVRLVDGPSVTTQLAAGR